MKKSLVLAMAMALGVTASAYAANPFSDVPAGHWAYDSISKLAAAGVIEGYGDTTFGGDKLMTRYEMAQIVAKAMAKGANVDKLAAEFADELDNLGVRVANLEKKADNVKITGQIRARYKHYDSTKDDESALRTRLWVAGQVNEDWTYTAMFANTQELNDSDGEEKTELQRAYLDGKVGGLTVRAGRWDEVAYTGNLADLTGDGIKVSYGDKVKVWGAALKANEATGKVESGNRVYLAGVNGKIGAVDAYAMYAKGTGSTAGIVGDTNKEIYNVGASLEVAKDLTLGYEYMWADKAYNDTVSKDGWVANLSYKGADAATPGSWGLSATYFDQPVNAYLAPTTDAKQFDDGYKGWGVVANYALAKNIVAELSYYDTEAKAADQEEKLFYADLYFTF